MSRGRSSRRIGPRALPRRPRRRRSLGSESASAAAVTTSTGSLRASPQPGARGRRRRRVAKPSTRIRSSTLRHEAEIVDPTRRPLGQKQLLDGDRRGRLPVGADDVDRGVRGLRVAELRKQFAHSLEPEAVARPGRERIEPPDGCHVETVLGSAAPSATPKPSRSRTSRARMSSSGARSRSSAAVTDRRLRMASATARPRSSASADMRSTVSRSSTSAVSAPPLSPRAIRVIRSPATSNAAIDEPTSTPKGTSPHDRLK